ncbi:hypothetical protein SUDANB95_02552 [Actinosynnema sp. ALI-1.44]
MTDFPPLSDADLHRIRAGSDALRRKEFFTTAVDTGLVCAMGADAKVAFVEDVDFSFVPLWTHPRLAEAEADALEFEDERPVAVALDDVLAMLDGFEEDDLEIAVQPAGGEAFVVSAERFREEVFTLRLRHEPGDEYTRAARRAAFHEDQRRRAEERLGLSPADREALVAHLDEHLEEHDCDDAFTAAAEWAEDRDLPWPPMARALDVLGCHCDCEVAANL